IPESIEIDISELDVNDSYSVADIKVSGDFTIENDPEETVVTVVPPTEEPTEEEIEAMEGESETEETEVVGEDKEDDEEEKEEEKFIRFLYQTRDLNNKNDFKKHHA